MLKLFLLIFTVQIVADCIYSSTTKKSKPVSLVCEDLTETISFKSPLHLFPFIFCWYILWWIQEQTLEFYLYLYFNPINYIRNALSKEADKLWIFKEFILFSWWERTNCMLDQIWWLQKVIFTRFLHYFTCTSPAAYVPKLFPTSQFF